MLSTDDLKFIAAVTQAPSLAAAARSLNVTPPAVSQRLRALETRLGVSLLDRSAGRITLTDEGELLTEWSARILAEIEEVSERLCERKGVVAGHLRIAGPTGFGRRYIAPAVMDFSRRHPDVRIDLELSDNPIRLKPSAWDIVIHIGELHSQPFQKLTLAPNDRLLCASPDYLARRGTPHAPADLIRHSCLTLRENDEDVTLWRFSGPDGSHETVRIDEGVSCNDGDVVRDWALAGFGIVLRSEWDMADDLRAGRLVRLLPQWRAPDAPVVALLGPRHMRAARTRRFLELLRQSLTPPPWRGQG
ncbi:LysR family transcriptional regulator [Desulfomicrobium escambiense]|uniref:LysR family transcriptional regulator n=1 Tax=Desulfomicrobium escambiense TaxID=29503 RepID=UPI00048CA847|nr:LysR family transcriptional regulator [Desulfomicrobium escambiense]